MLTHPFVLIFKNREIDGDLLGIRFAHNGFPFHSVTGRRHGEFSHKGMRPMAVLMKYRNFYERSESFVGGRWQEEAKVFKRTSFVTEPDGSDEHCQEGEEEYPYDH